jgi:hypothetical protein
MIYAEARGVCSRSDSSWQYAYPHSGFRTGLLCDILIIIRTRGGDGGGASRIYSYSHFQEEGMYYHHDMAVHPPESCKVSAQNHQSTLRLLKKVSMDFWL